METIKTIKKIKFSRYGETKTLKLIRGQYENGRLYLWLLTYRGEPYADITENHPEIGDEILQFNLVKWEAERAIIDGDFINIMGGEREAKSRIIDNIDHCLGGGDVEGWPALVLFNN